MAVDTSVSGRSRPVTPHDTNAQPVGRSLFVGVAGDVTGRLLSDTEDDTWTLGAGYHPLRFSYIRATGTTADQLKILF